MMAAGIKAKAESDKNQQEIDKQRSKIEELKDTILLNRKKNKELNQKAKFLIFLGYERSRSEKASFV